MLGEPIWVRTLSSHCKGPFRCSSIQQGVLVTVCLLQDIGKGVGWGMLRMSRSTHTRQNAFSRFGDRLLPRARDTDCLARPRPGGGATNLLKLPGQTPSRKGFE